MSQRERRIKELVQSCEEIEPVTIDQFLIKARELFPYVTHNTRYSYAWAAFEILKRRKEKQ
jgi:hypothetical protein